MVHYGRSLTLLVAVLMLANLMLLAQSAGVSRKAGSSISCFACNSRNESDIHCHDPYNPAMSKYVENCKVPKQNHIGVFPAKFCVKVVGKTVATGESLMIRACSLENMDNQCGNFKFEGNIYKGCILTCDFDGCNAAHRPSVSIYSAYFHHVVVAFSAWLLPAAWMATTYHL